MTHSRISETGAPGQPPGEIGIRAIFRCFFQVGATGFGGVLPMAYHELVRRRQWLNDAEFTEALALCQVLPGPNIINLAIVFGVRKRGWAGGVAGLLGLTAFPFVVVLLLATLYVEVSELPAVQRATGAVASAAAGLICAIAARMLWPMLRKPRALVVIALVVVAVAVLALPLLTVLLVLGPLSIGLAAVERSAADE